MMIIIGLESRESTRPTMTIVSTAKKASSSEYGQGHFDHATFLFRQVLLRHRQWESVIATPFPPAACRTQR